MASSPARAKAQKQPQPLAKIAIMKPPKGKPNANVVVGSKLTDVAAESSEPVAFSKHEKATSCSPGTEAATAVSQSLEKDTNSSVFKSHIKDTLSYQTENIKSTTGNLDSSAFQGVGVERYWPTAGTEESRAFEDQLREISSLEPVAGQSAFASTPNAALTTSDVASMRVPSSVSPDPRLLEALAHAHDRVWVLKLEQDISDFLKNETDMFLDLPQCNSYHRLLAYKMADYYLLGHGVAQSTSSVRLVKKGVRNYPPPLTSILLPQMTTTTSPPVVPQKTILRRYPVTTNGSGVRSADGSEAGDTAGDRPKTETFEQRKAKYQAARDRIMGTEDSQHEVKDKQESQSSSSSQRRSKRKLHVDDDDDFQPRSNFEARYTTPYTAYSFPPSYFPVEPNTGFSGTQFVQAPNVAWACQAYQPGQQNQPGMDLAKDFQRLSVQNTPQMSIPSYDGNQSTYSTSPHGWQSQRLPIHPLLPGFCGQGSGFNGQMMLNGPVSQEPQPYAYGQLPNQTFPGRSSSKHEHPIPGSYKGRLFNPQSQAFVPSNQKGYSTTSSLSRQGSNQSHASLYDTSYKGNMTQTRQQQMTHPLPQPVFAQQPTPNVTLPPKPGSSLTPQHSSNSVTSTASQTGSITKYEAPPSLPAKPPPSVRRSLR